jgi:hypothetical protein
VLSLHLTHYICPAESAYGVKLVCNWKPPQVALVPLTNIQVHYSYILYVQAVGQITLHPIFSDINLHIYRAITRYLRAQSKNKVEGSDFT